MKEQELREIATCALCGKKIGATGIPIFYRVRIECYGLNLPALQRQQGLGMQISPMLAAVMGPDEDLAEKISESNITVCADCNTDKRICVAAMAELDQSEEEAT